MPLFDSSIRNAKPGAKSRRLFDSNGLYLEVSPNGGKWWRLKYRFGGKEKRISLGVYPEIGLKEARDRRDEARKKIALGVDPSEERKASRLSQCERDKNSFEMVGREWMEGRSKVWVASHGDRMAKLLERDIFPWLGNRPVAEITAPELLAVIRRIESRGAKETAHRALSKCGQIFRYAVATGKALRDPSGDLRGALAPVKTQHLSAITEPKLVAPLLRVIDTYEGSLVVRCALRLAPLVFVRPGELRQAKWQDIDLQKAEWSFKVSKTDVDHVVPLSTQAVSILQEICPLTGNGIFVFPSARSQSRPMSDNAILAAMRRLDISKEQMCGHGFRAMARTILDEVLGVRPEFIEHQLAHKVKDPLGRAYNRTTHLVARQEMMQKWADYLDRIKLTLN